MNHAPDDLTLHLHAALDGELDAVGVMEIEAKLATDPERAAEYARLVALREAIRARIPRETAPDALRARMISMTQTVSRAPLVAPRRLKPIGAPYRSLAAALMVGIVLGAGAYGLFIPAPADDDVQQAIVSGFIRGRLAGQPVDVVTSDRHTVKPWLAGKISGATTVVDLAPAGFPLVGGRVDVIGRTPVPTLVYQRREHQIALSELPAPSDDAFGNPRRETRDGYSLLRWVDKGRIYIAVSDLPPAELDVFGSAFRKAASAEREDAPKL